MCVVSLDFRGSLKHLKWNMWWLSGIVFAKTVNHHWVSNGNFTSKQWTTVGLMAIPPSSFGSSHESTANLRGPTQVRSIVLLISRVNPLIAVVFFLVWGVNHVRVPEVSSYRYGRYGQSVNIYKYVCIYIYICIYIHILCVRI